jgi:hypothetical protein
MVCSEAGCTETSIVSLEDRAICRAHYLAYCYRRLEEISEIVSVKHYEMTQEQAEVTSRFLQTCMRSAADIASSQQSPSNLEKAQVYDVLLWASELHGRLRRSPRRSIKFPVLLRSEIPGRIWEVRTETQVVSRHGMRFTCDVDVRAKDTITCIRLDTGRRAEAIVAWVNRTESGLTEAGIEILREENFWGVAWDAPLGDISSLRRH